MSNDDDWGDDCDAEFFMAVDDLVAAHQTFKSTQQAAQGFRGSQPGSPLAPPPQHVVAPGVGQQPAATAPLQQNNGIAAGGHQAVGLAQKPPLGPGAQLPYGTARPGTAASVTPAMQQQQAWQQPPPQQQPPMRQQQQAPAAYQPPPQPPQQSWQPQQAPPAAQHAQVAQDPAGQLAQLQADMGRLDAQNRMLSSNLQHKDREVAGLRQRVQQLERQQGGAGGTAAAAQQQRSTFAVAEMQRQLDSLRQQLMFKEQEMEDLKRQHSDRTEKLRQAEASVTDLKQQLRQRAAQPAAAAAPLTEPAPAEVQDDQRQEHGRPRSAGPPATSSAGPTAMPRSSGQKRRQSGTATARNSSAGAEAAEAAADAVAAAANVAEHAAPAPMAPPLLPLLDPAVLAAASLGSQAGWIDQLMAACGGSIAVLTGAAGSTAAGADGALAAGDAAAAAVPTALLLRSRLAAAAQAPDADSLSFTAAFQQRMQQAACGAVAPAVLLDTILAMVAASVAQAHAHAAAASSSTSGHSSCLPQQRMQLIAAGLHVAQHLMQLDAGCRHAALAAFQSGTGGSSSSSRMGGSLSTPPRAKLSTRVTLSSSSGPAAVPAAAAVPLGVASSNWCPAASSGAAAVLPGTALVVSQHLAVFGSLGGTDGLLPAALAAALWLGRQHEGVAAGALRAVLELARCLQGTGSLGALAPVLTSGAMELFMRPPALRLQALHLLQLLLGDISLAQLFEGSLALAAATRGEPGPPTATAGTTGSGGREGGGGSTTPGHEAVAGGGDGAEPMQADDLQRRGGEQGPWLGAAVVAERLLDSLSLDDGMLPASQGGATSGRQPAGGAAGCAPGALPGLEAGGASGTAVARAAMQLVAVLREQRQHAILVSLLLDDACGAPGCMLAQRLVQLAEAALAHPGEDAALMLLCPLQWPDGSNAAGGSSRSTLLHQQAAWQQRLRVAQEALMLLRGLLVDDSCGVAAMDDLVAIPAAARVTLTTLSRLARLEPPPSGAGGAAVAVPPPALLALWARAIGSSTDQPSIAEAMACGSGSGSGSGSSAPEGLPCCSVEDVVYMSRSLRRRVLVRMQQSSVAQG